MWVALGGWPFYVAGVGTLDLQWHVVQIKCFHNSPFRLHTHKRDLLVLDISRQIFYSRVFDLLRLTSL